MLRTFDLYFILVEVLRVKQNNTDTSCVATKWQSRIITNGDVIIRKHLEIIKLVAQGQWQNNQSSMWCSGNDIFQVIKQTSNEEWETQSTCYKSLESRYFWITTSKTYASLVSEINENCTLQCILDTIFDSPFEFNVSDPLHYFIPDFFCRPKFFDARNNHI